MALKLPPLKHAQLKALAFQCGTISTGTKAVIASHLVDAIHADDGTKRKKRILSIDMGIRNLAYCVLDQSQKASSTPSIVAWERLAVSSKPANGSQECLTPPPKENFEPAVFAAITYKLLRHTLLLFQPTHVLIERQRFRSMGSHQILEWTIRVNMFESMLYAVLHTLAEEKIWKGVVKAITPGKVGPYWVGTGKQDGQLKKTRNTKEIKARNKGAKIDLVQNWLSNGKMVVPQTVQAKATAKAYIEKWHRPFATEKGKLDDLADCLLQGLAWIEWERKKKSILEHGVDVDSLV